MVEREDHVFCSEEKDSFKYIESGDKKQQWPIAVCE